MNDNTPMLELETLRHLLRRYEEGEDADKVVNDSVWCAISGYARTLFTLSYDQQLAEWAKLRELSPRDLLYLFGTLGLGNKLPPGWAADPDDPDEVPF